MASVGMADEAVKLPSVDDILKRNVEALGGEKAMRKLKNREARGKIELAVFGAEIPAVMRQAAPNKEMMELTIEGLGTIRDVFAGSKGWTEPPDGMVTKKKERELVDELGPAWKSINHRCEGHVIYNIIPLTCAAIQNDVSGQVHWALSSIFNLARHHSAKVLCAIVDEWLDDRMR